MPATDSVWGAEMEDRTAIATRTTPVDLQRLHIEMDYLARAYWDLQKTRIMIGNRRAGLERATGALGAILLDEAGLAPLEQHLNREEARLNRQLEHLAAQHPLGPWVKSTRGVGLASFARLMGITGSLDRFLNPAKLWKFLGLAVTDGRAPTRRKGEPWTHTDCQGGHLQLCKPGCTTDHHKNCRPGEKGTAYSPQGRTLCFQIADSFVKTGGPYREHYDRKKAEYGARELVGPSDCPLGKHHRDAEGRTVKCSKAHVHMAAMRYAVKMLIKDLWIEWQRQADHHMAPKLHLPAA
jgi:hypothetical protein